MLEISGSDLQQFGGKLKNLWLGDNTIQLLRADLFNNNPNMEIINFWNNNLKHIDEGTFGGLSKLRQLELHGNNPCICEKAYSRSDVKALITEAERKCTVRSHRRDRVPGGFQQHSD